MIFRFALSFLCGLVICLSHASAELNPVWQKTYGGPTFDAGRDLLQLADGGYVAVGWINDSADDMYLVRTDANGDSLWTRIFNIGGIDQAHGITQTADGGFAVTGTTSGPGQAFEAFIYRLDANGDSLWFRYYGGSLGEDGRDILELPDGSLVMAGNTRSYGNGNEDFWLLKVSSTGDSLWSHTYGGALQDQCHGLALAADGGFVLGGSNESIASGGVDMWMVKTDSLGNEEWDLLLGGDNQDWGYDLIGTSDGNFLIAGTSSSFGFSDPYAVKVDINGNIIWAEPYETFGIQRINGINETSDGYVLCGYSSSAAGAGGQDFFLMELDTNGQLVDSGLAGGSTDDEAYAVIQNSNGDFVMTGETESYGAGEADLWLVLMSDSAINNPPGDFSRILPADGDTTSAFSVLFAWQTAEDLDLDTVIYLFDVWTPTFTTPEPASVETTATSMTVQIPNPPDGTPFGVHEYFWTVSATDGIDTIDALNGQGMFFFDYVEPNLPPQAFTRIHPADDSVVTSHNLVLNWTPAIDPNGDVIEYTLEIDSETHFAVPSKVMTQDTFVAVVIPAPAPLGLHDFTWTVLASDGEFVIGPSNGAGSFQFLEGDPPGDFERVFPPDDGIITESEITLTWTASIDPDGTPINYVVEISTPTFETPVPSEASVSDTFLTITIPDPPDGTPSGDHIYQWTVIATDGFNAVPASNGQGQFIYQYTAPNMPPGDYERVSPEDGSTQTESEITLTWTPAVDPNGDIVDYIVSIGSPTFETPVPDGATVQDTFLVVTIPDPEPGTPSGTHEYIWTLVATDGEFAVNPTNGNGSFQYQYIAPNGPPGEFERTSPEDDTLIPFGSFDSRCAWTTSIDPEGDEIEYIFHIESNYDYPFGPTDTVITDTEVLLWFDIPLAPLDETFDFHWTVHATDGVDTVEAANGEGFFQLDIIVSADDNPALAYEFGLSAYPNPFNPSTTIDYTIEQAGHVTLTVTDILGRQVAELVNETLSPGRYSLNWQARSAAGGVLPSGIYFARLQAESRIAVHKLLLTR